VLAHYLRKHVLPAQVLLPFQATAPLPIGESEPCMYIRVSPCILRHFCAVVVGEREIKEERVGRGVEG
jgi:hypothetical protein